MRTKAFHAFEQKLIYFDDDIDLMDVIRTGVIQEELTEVGSKHVLKNVNPQKHNHIARRKNSVGSRKVLINHLRSTLYSSYVKDIYEEVTHYLRTILKKAAENGFDAGRIIGEHTFKIDAKTALELGNWNSLVQLIADSVFQALESERSTLKLLDKLSKKLALNVKEATINAALPYLEVRHCLVHSDGLLSAEFKEKHKNIVCKDGYVQLDYKFICNLRTSIRALISEYDQCVVASGILKSEDLQP